MVGIDEVGRGCWAGPLVVVAARQTADLPAGLTDSKLLTKIRREQLFPTITASCDIGEGWVSVTEIDKFGLTAAMQLGVTRALEAIAVDHAEEIIMDGSINYCDSLFRKVRCEPKADLNYPIVSAASIYAKVVRDAYMTEQHYRYPEYGFSRHVGYGTKEHSQALKKYGISAIHRLSFTPIKALAGL